MAKTPIGTKKMYKDEDQNDNFNEFKKDAVEDESVPEPKHVTQPVVPAVSDVKKPEPAPKPPKPKKYICRVKCWTPKYGLFEVDDVIEFGPADSIPSHFDEIE